MKSEDRLGGEAPGSAPLDWFSVRCLFGHDIAGSNTYEERVTLWRAASFEEAVAEAEAEANEYAELVGCHYLGLAQSYQLVDLPGHGAEVYSLMRDSDLPADDYLTAFFDTGSEHQGVAGEVSEAAPARLGGTATPATESPNS
jgi:hypothetical protein